MKNFRYYGKLTAAALAVMFIVNLFGTVPAVSAESVKSYNHDGYMIEYAIMNEWEGNQNIQITLTNTGTDTIYNWALGYDAGGSISGLWNAQVYGQQENQYILKNAGYNSEISPGANVVFGYTLSGEDFKLPEDIIICSKRVDITEGIDIYYNMDSDYGYSFLASVTIANNSDTPIEAWQLAFDTDAAIYSVWNAALISGENGHFVVGNDWNTSVINANSSITLNINGGKENGAGLVMENFALNGVVIPLEFDFGGGGEDEEEITLTATADYDIESGLVTVNWESTEPSGIFEVWTSYDGINFDIAGMIENAVTYSFVPEDFELLYVSVRQTSGERTAESDVCFVFNTEEEIDWNDQTDADEDKLLDVYEKYVYLTDPENPDTDGDGLPDGYEALSLGSDPAKSDTDDNGVSDGSEDFDEDRLTNYDEFINGTDPYSADSDNDGLGDYEEIYTYSTDPLNPDSDGDGVSDGDEITLGLNPNGSNTNGVPDSEQTFEQTVGADSDAFEQINNDEDNPFRVSVEIEAAGVAENNIYATESVYTNVVQSDSIIGVVPEFVYTDGLAVDEITIKFEVDDSVIANTLGIYADNPEFEGIKRLNVFMFIEEVNMLLPVETFHDVANNTVYTTTDRVGTYCLMDMEIWLNNLENLPEDSYYDEEAEEDNSEKEERNAVPETFSASARAATFAQRPAAMGATVNGSRYKDNFDVIFMIDQRKFNSSDFSFIKTNVIEMSEVVFDKSPNARVQLLIMTSVSGSKGKNSGYYILKNSAGSEYFEKTSGDYIGEIENALISFNNIAVAESDCLVSDAIGYVCVGLPRYIIWGRTAYGFSIFDSNESYYRNADGLSAIANLTSLINISVISDVDEEIANEISYANTLLTTTNGAYIQIDETYDKHFSAEALEHIYGKPVEISNGYKAITALGYRTIKLDKPITEGYKAVAADIKANPDERAFYARQTSYSNSDTDILLDCEEIMYEFHDSDFGVTNELINWVDGKAELLTFAEIIAKTSTFMDENLFYVKDGLKRYQDITGDNGLWVLDRLRVLPIVSDPTSEDGDGDGIRDRLDGTPLADFSIPDLFTRLIEEEFVKYDDIRAAEETLVFADNELLICTVPYGDILKNMSQNPAMKAEINSYGISDDWYGSIVNSTSKSYIMSHRIINTVNYTVVTLEELDFDVNSMYNIKLYVRQKLAQSQNISENVNGYDFARHVRDSAINVSGYIDAINNKPADWIYSQEHRDSLYNLIPDTGFKSSIVNQIDGSYNVQSGVIKGATMYVTFLPSITAYAFTAPANALEYDYLYRQAYFNEYGKYPSAASPLQSMAKCSGEMLLNMEANIVTGIYDTFVNEDGSFNISGAQEFVGMMIGSAAVASLGSVNIKELKFKSKGEKVPQQLIDDAQNVGKVYDKVKGKNASPVNTKGGKVFTYTTRSGKTVNYFVPDEIIEKLDAFTKNINSSKYEKTAAWFDNTNPAKSGRATSGNYFGNEYILKPELMDYAKNSFFEKFPNIKKLSSTTDYTSFWENALGDDLLKAIPSEYFSEIGTTSQSVMIEMAKLREAIDRTKQKAISEGLYNQFGNPSFHDAWNVENCAEVWAAHQAILDGVKFENIRFHTITTETGALAAPCRNCSITFAELFDIMNTGG